jgi:hypothetical protein
MHNKTIDADTIIAALPTLDAEELDRVSAAVESLSRRSGGSTVLERRSYRNGLLQSEVRTYTRKDGTEVRRGPYWYFHHRQSLDD